MAAKNPEVYKSILIAVFRSKAPDPKTGDILFTQSDLRAAAEKLGLEVRNFPDLTYNLRSRAPLPDEILKAGYSTIAIRGRGRYALVRGDDKVTIPERTSIIEVSTNPIPKAVRDLLRDDEQSVLSAIGYMDVISDFMSTKAYRLQGHLRTTGSLGQQVEADDIWVVEERGSRTILPVEAKGPRERLGRQQMLSTLDAVLSKIPGVRAVPLAVQLEPSGHLLVVAFEYTKQGRKISSIEPKRFARYRPRPKLPQWP